MNFLGLRSSSTAASEQPLAQESHRVSNLPPKPAVTLEGLIAQDSFPESMASENRDVDYDYASENGLLAQSSSSHDECSHVDVTEDEGWIAIPYKELPDNWTEASDMSSFRLLDRFFVFPGEQVHIVACLSACKQDTEIITPFKVAALMNKKTGQSSMKPNGNAAGGSNSMSGKMVDGVTGGEERDQCSPNEGETNSEKFVTSGESLIRMEDHRRQTETLLQRFNNSHFFVRISEADEPLWSKKGDPDAALKSSGEVEKLSIDGSERSKIAKKKAGLSAIVDRGNFDSSITGGVARNAIKCSSLSNGDIVVVLQINVGVDYVRDPVLEILQFEKFQEKGLSPKNWENPVHDDPCGELLRWLIPLDNSIPPPVHSVSPPQLSSSASIRGTSTKPASSGSSSSQLFSFGHFRSYSMSSLPQNGSPAIPVVAPNSEPDIDLDDRDQFSFQKIRKNDKSRNEDLLSFRGVPLEPGRFSVRCGLEGIYIPGRRWRRKIEIIQPVEIKSSVADCNTEDLICVQIKNICPAHTPDIVVYIDAITIVYEEPSKGGPPLSFPFACIEAGNDHSLPNLKLRRGEEHSFILKPATSQYKSSNSRNEKSSQSSHLAAASSLRHSSYNEVKYSSSSADQYAILVSCRCNYTESRLFFKQPTSWRPRVLKDLMISVASEISRQTLGSNGNIAQLPVQVLTLRASNLTSEDLTLTVLAPASFTSPPSVLSLSSSPTSPVSPLVNIPEWAPRLSNDRPSDAGLTVGPIPTEEDNGVNNQAIPISDVLPSSDLYCTHLWLQSRVPLGCVPAQSTATIKLEVLPLTDGIITLDSLQIDVKEKGITYVPEHSLKINATSSITREII